jgi:hypothetical protein
MLEMIRCSVQCRRGAWDLRDVRNGIVSPYALLACEFLFPGLSKLAGQ